MSTNPHRDLLYLFACYLECRRKRNAAACHELAVALHDSNCVTRAVVEALLSQRSQRRKGAGVAMTHCQSQG
jgi:hypothetical protein